MNSHNRGFVQVHTSPLPGSLYAFLLLILINCTPKSIEKKEDYSFSRPDEVYELPGRLKEVSGIAFANDSTLACVEDEHGIIYLYNLNEKKISREIEFASKGDFEDIAIKNDTAYVLRSDGMVTEISNYRSTPQVREFPLQLKKGTEVEGLFYSSANNTLIIASKSRNSLYSFALMEGRMIGEPTNIKTTFEFLPSAVAIHPITHEYYILSSVRNSLLITSPQGEVLKAIELRSGYFIQPEGIAFNYSGDLYICNEGRHGKGNILMFRYKKDN